MIKRHYVDILDPEQIPCVKIEFDTYENAKVFNTQLDKTIWFEARAILEHFEVKQLQNEPITERDLHYVNEMLENVARISKDKNSPFNPN